MASALEVMAQALLWGKQHGLTPEEVISQAQTLPEAIVNLRASSYLSIAGLVVLLYDTLLTIPEEIRLVWPMPWGLIKCIWILSRYIVPGTIALYNYQLFPVRAGLSDSVSFAGPRVRRDWQADGLLSCSCRTYVVVLAWLINIAFCAGNWLLLLRVSALWGRKKMVIYPLYACFFALYLAITIILGFSSVSMSKNIVYNPFVNVCDFLGHRPWLLVHSQWLPILFDLLIFVMTLVKAKQDNIARKGSRGDAPVLFILFRDGGIYAIVITALRIANFVAWAFLTESLVYLWLGFLFAIVTVLINRFYLNLRRVAWATAAALLTNGSMRSRSGGPMGPFHLRALVEDGTIGKRGAPSPFAELEEEGMPVIDVTRADIDETMMIEFERRRVRLTPELEEGMPPPPSPSPIANGILVSRGVVVTR